MWDNMIIVEKGNLPHTQCLRCDILVSWASLNGCHPNTAQCAKGVEWKHCRLAAEEARAGTYRSFHLYDLLINMVTVFK